MNSLEFINDRIRSYETMLLTAIDTKCSVEQIRHYEERLNVFHQIKTELEIFELLKPQLDLEYQDGEDDKFMIGMRQYINLDTSQVKLIKEVLYNE
mgnify:CR=1 FL=1